MSFMLLIFSLIYITSVLTLASNILHIFAQFGPLDRFFYKDSTVLLKIISFVRL